MKETLTASKVFASMASPYDPFGPVTLSPNIVFIVFELVQSHLGAIFSLLPYVINSVLPPFTIYIRD